MDICVEYINRQTYKYQYTYSLPHTHLDNGGEYIYFKLHLCISKEGEKIGQSYDKEVILVHLWGLQPCGLVDKISAKEYESLHKRGGNRRLLHPEGVFLYKRTDLGNSFLDFIVKGMPEDNSYNNET